MANYQKPKGTYDLIGQDVLKYNYVVSSIRNTVEQFGFSEVVTPIFENTEVFLRIGDESDIVSKEMYTFKDRGDRSITLRPEGTAAVVRCFLENKLYTNAGISKFYYIGPMFRYERPQAGRYRQLQQAGVEVFGCDSPLLDADVIYSGYSVLKQLGITNIKLIVNTIGDFASRAAYAKALQEYFADKIDTMCSDCQRRLTTNPMRILDCKADKTNPVLINAPTISDYLSDESKSYFQAVLNALDKLEVPYEVDRSLVRGLDYYTDTVFEFIIESDDNLNGLAIGAGGRYANLVESMNGPKTPGIGYAFGIERITSVLGTLNKYPQLDRNYDAVVFGLDEESKLLTLKVANALRGANLKVDLDYKNTSLKQQFKLADRLQARFIIIIGEEERLNSQATIKDKLNNTQETIAISDIINYIKER